MNEEEIRSTIEQIKAQVKAKPENKDKTDDEIDEMILDSFFKSYTEGEMTKEDLLGLAEEMGYEPDEGFEQDPEAANEINPEEAPAPAKGEGEEISKEDLEATQTMEPGESKEEFQEKIEDVKEGEHVSEDEPEAEEGEEEEEEEDEDAERKAASELWKMDLSKKD